MYRNPTDKKHGKRKTEAEVETSPSTDLSVRLVVVQGHGAGGRATQRYYDTPDGPLSAGTRCTTVSHAPTVMGHYSTFVCNNR